MSSTHVSGPAAIGTALLALLGAGACGGDAAAPGTLLRINLETEPPTLDWTRATDHASILVIEQIMRGLTRLGPGLEPVPELAASWETPDDGRTWRFRLREDVVWSDGVPLHAQQFVDAWRRLLDPALAAEYAYYLYPVRGARAVNAGEATLETLGVRAAGPHLLEVELAEPLAFFPALVSFMVTYPVRLDVIERHGEAWTDAGRLVSLGPYLLDEWRHEYRVRLRANPRYHGAAPRTERVLLYMVSDPATQLLLFEQGRLDLVRLPPLEIRRYADRPEYLSAPLLRGYYYGFDTRRPPFDDPRVRRAFARAIDRAQFPAVLRGGELPWSSWIPPGMLGADPAIGLRFDPDAARAELLAAGVDARALAPIVVGYNSERPENKLVAEKVQDMWTRELGVRVELQPREWKAYLKQLELDPPPVFRLGWGADYADPHSFMELFTSYSANNHTGWASPDYDALVERAASERDPARRRELYDRAQRLLCEQELPIVPFFVSSASYAVASRVRGFSLNPLELYALEEVWLE